MKLHRQFVDYTIKLVGSTLFKTHFEVEVKCNRFTFSQPKNLSSIFEDWSNTVSFISYLGLPLNLR